MLNSSYVPSNDRQALRDYYYQVKACTTWCVKMGQSAILQTPDYPSRATMRLPMNLRVRWYEHIDGRSDRSTLVEFEKWLRGRMETLFNVCEEWNRKQRISKSKPGLKLNPLATITETSPNAPTNPNHRTRGRRRKSHQVKRSVSFTSTNILLPFVLSLSLSTCRIGEKLHGTMDFVSIA